MKQKITQRRNDSFDQSFVTAWQRNLQILSLQRNRGDSGFWLILISIVCLTLGCASNDQPAPSTATSNQLSALKSDSALSLARHAAGSSVIRGRVFFKGPAPAPKIIRMKQDAVCAAGGGEQVYSEEIVLTPDSALVNVFVYVKEGLGRQRYPAPATPVILDQHKCRYTPHVFGMQVGQTLKILNSDPTFHNVHAAAKINKPFNLGMSKVEKVKTRTFDQVEVMIPLQCNVHPWMSAYVGVLDHPFYEVTDSTGSFALQAMPAGEYVVAAWHEVFGSMVQEVQIKENETKTVDFIFTRR